MDGIVVINKPQTFTSMDCCAILRSLYHEKKVGHTGTLDPNATGVLPICLGKATKLIEYLENTPKTYIAGFKLGCNSDTEDVWGTLEYHECQKFVAQDIIDILPHGEIEQIPPMYSAKKIKGQKLYDIARSGAIVERAPNKIYIYSAELKEFDGINGLIEICCSRGTYIRTICADIGKTLGCGAVMTSLVRTKSSGFTIEESIDFNDFIKVHNNIKNGVQADFNEIQSNLQSHVLSIEKAMEEYPRVNLDRDQMKLIINGNKNFINYLPDLSSMGHIVAAYYSGKLFAVLKDSKIDKVINVNL